VATSAPFAFRLDRLYLANSVDRTKVYAMFQIHGASKRFGGVDALFQVVLHMCDQGWPKRLHKEYGIGHTLPLTSPCLIFVQIVFHTHQCCFFFLFLSSEFVLGLVF
jgi:hypothetical protein